MASDQFLDRAGQITQAHNSLVGMLDTSAATGIEVLNSSDGQLAAMLQATSDEDGFNYLLFQAGIDQHLIDMSPEHLRLAIGSGILENNNRYLTEILPETQQFALDGKLHFDPADSVGGGNQAALDITNALSKGLGDIGQTSFVAGLIPGLSFGQHFDFNNQERMLNNLSDYRLLPGDMKSDLLVQISTGRYDAAKDGVFSGFGLFGKLGRTLFGIETAAESASAEAGKKVRLGGVSGTKGGNLADALNDRIGRALGAPNNIDNAANAASTSSRASGAWNKSTVLDRNVYQRNDLFDPNAKSTWKVRGRTVQGTNLERMASGRAPIGYDGKSVELHHLTQTEVNGLTGSRGSLAEVGSVYHSQNGSVLHVPSNSAQSFRYTRFKDSAEYRNPATDFISVPKDLNAKVLTEQAKQFNAFQSDYWKLRAQNWGN